MAYSDFTLDGVIQQFGLRVASEADVFAQATLVIPSELLKQTLADVSPLALSVGTAKAYSEFIIAPVLAEVWRQFRGCVSLFSGVDFTGDAEAGLSGVCDFLFSLTPLQLIVQLPAVAVVEPADGDVKAGLGQCIAVILAAQRFNERRGVILPHLYGVVTTGSNWKFLRLTGANVVVEQAEYHIGQLETIFGILVFMVREALEQQGGVSQ